MALTSRKITNEDILNNGFQSLNNNYRGDAENAKKQFDKFTENVLMVKLNALIDDLEKQTTTSGAEQIGIAGVQIGGVTYFENSTLRAAIVAALTKIKTDIEAVSVGTLPDGSITAAKLASGAIAANTITGFTRSTTLLPAISAEDTILQAIGKIDKLIANLKDGTESAYKAEFYKASDTDGSIAKALTLKQNSLTFDELPTDASTNVVKSGGVFLKLADKVETKIVTVTLAAASWASNAQTLAVSQITGGAKETVRAYPQFASQEGYARGKVRISAASAGSITFACTTTPTTALTVDLEINNNVVVAV